MCLPASPSWPEVTSFFVVVQVQLSPFLPHSPDPSHPHLPPMILPPLGFVHVSFLTDRLRLLLSTVLEARRAEISWGAHIACEEKIKAKGSGPFCSLVGCSFYIGDRHSCPGEEERNAVSGWHSRLVWNNQVPAKSRACQGVTEAGGGA